MIIFVTVVVRASNPTQIYVSCPAAGLSGGALRGVLGWPSVACALLAAACSRIPSTRRYVAVQHTLRQLAGRHAQIVNRVSLRCHHLQDDDMMPGPVVA
jgi:hypothetical protein